MSQRLCRKCSAKLGVDDDSCAACGASNPVPLPWYTPLVGLMIIALLFFLLVDFGDIRQVLGID